MTSRSTLCAGALLGAVAVLSGAFGAHALDARLDARAADWFETAVSWHARHALALLMTGALWQNGGDDKAFRLASLGLLSGTLVFSGSLYVMALTGWTRLGMVTPIGGVLLVGGWLALLAAVARRE